MSAPYAVGDRARVLHNGPRGTTLATLRVRAVRAVVGSSWWRVWFEGVERSVYVRPDGRDGDGYVEPVKS